MRIAIRRIEETMEKLLKKKDDLVLISTSVAFQFLKDLDHVLTATNVGASRTGGEPAVATPRRKLFSCLSSLMTKREVKGS